MDYAGFWMRFIAFNIDFFVLWVVLLIMYLVGFDSYLFSLILTALYYSLMNSSSTQATLGKMALGLIVTDTEGNRVTFLRALLRYFVSIISGFILLIGYLIQPFTERKQTLHDLIAGTLVLSK